MIRLHALAGIRPFTLLLGLVCLLLAVALWARIEQPAPDRLAAELSVEPVDELEPAVVPEVVTPADLSAYSDVFERPLFVAGRRMPEPAAEPAAEQAPKVAPNVPAPDPPRARLTGVVVVADQRLALVDDQRTGAARRLGEGDDLGGWTVASVNPTSLTLEHGGQAVELKMARSQSDAGHRSTSTWFAPQDGNASAPPSAESAADQEFDRILEALNQLPNLGLDPEAMDRRRAELETLLAQELQRQDQ